MTAHELAEFDRIKNDVYKIINGNGIVISEFTEVNRIVTEIAEYIMGKEQKTITLADGTNVVVQR